MTEVKIDRSKLLGFRLASNETNVAQDVKLGAKVGTNGKNGPGPAISDSES